MSSPAGIEAVVIPAHNEARTIRAVAAGALQQLPFVIVVDDASTDGTADLLEGLPVIVLRNEQNRGKAASLMRGAEAAIERGASAIVTLDGDGQHDPGDIAAMLQAHRVSPAGIVIGARLHHRDRIPPARYWAPHNHDAHDGIAQRCAEAELVPDHRTVMPVILRHEGVSLVQANRHERQFHAATSSTGGG